ncbi:unnamed protein product [Linum trigynum]|uniref:GDT1 family protein n=1 Tax=Linum trigynum TaxID=586398 RepID=A0AAV2EQG8_9ROSI
MVPPPRKAASERFAPDGAGDGRDEDWHGDGRGLAPEKIVVRRYRFGRPCCWRDREIKTRLALAAASSPLGVIAGALAGHGVATLIAVLGGSLLGTILSEKVIVYTGGILFLVFAAMTLIEIVS